MKTEADGTGTKTLNELKDVARSKEDQIAELKAAMEAIKKINNILARSATRRKNEG